MGLDIKLREGVMFLEILRYLEWSGIVFGWKE